MSENFLVNKKILIVDDQDDLLDFMSMVIQSLGCVTVLARNGKEAFGKFEQDDFDLIISDVRMPLWRGEKLLAEVRQVSDIPFILMTGYAELHHYDVLDAGADAYFGKPFSSEEIKIQLDKALLPAEHRLKMPANSSKEDKTLELLIPAVDGNSDFQLGKRGFFIAGSKLDDFSNYKKMDLINLEIKFMSGDIKVIIGKGRVLWVREDDPSLINGCGIEFECLEENCLGIITSYILENRIKKVIPRGDKLIA